jgi:aryl-alcohol dehydrogenase-like predicted oxidoreductase
METRRLGSTDLHLTEIGLGTWAIGGGDWRFSWGPQDDEQSVKTIHRALELGVNWIDTAAVYGLGHSEEIAGRAIKGFRHRPLVATKCGLCWDKDRQVYGCLKRESVRAEAEASLRRLGIETIDLYQVHWPQPDEDLEEGWAAIADLVREGKVRYAGASNFSVAQLRRAQAIHPVASLQPPYSMLARGVETDLLPYCAANGIGVVVYSPMQKGLLTGKITPERVAQFPADDHRRRDPEFQPPRLAVNMELAEGLRRLAEGRAKTAAHLAIAWVLRRPEVTVAIVGARKPSQVDETVGAAGWSLSPDDLAAVDALLARRASRSQGF